MAQLDVSELLLDPDFINTITLIHRTATINTKGEQTLVETTVSTIGSVQPVSGKELLRLPESLRSADVRTFYIKAPILSDGSSQYPDLIEFNGKRFEIRMINDWLNYGFGWNSGTCVRQDISA